MNDKIKEIMLRREKDFKHSKQTYPEPHEVWVNRLFKNHGKGNSNLIDWFKIFYEEAKKESINKEISFLNTVILKTSRDVNFDKNKTRSAISNRIIKLKEKLKENGKNLEDTPET